MKKTYVSMQLNGEPVEFLAEPSQTLLECLRDNLHLTGTKEGCRDGNCGSCCVMRAGTRGTTCPVLGGGGGGQGGAVGGVGAGPEGDSVAEGLYRPRGVEVRHLHAGVHCGGEGAAGPGAGPERGTHSLVAGQ